MENKTKQENERVEVKTVAMDLEDIVNLKLSYAIGTARVCAMAFEHEDAFASVNEEDAANAFWGICEQLEAIGKELKEISGAIFDGEYKSVYERRKG